jgi:hypothetical protein
LFQCIELNIPRWLLNARLQKLILSYLLGLCFGIGCIRLRIKRRYSYLFASLLVIVSIFLISLASTYARWPLSFPFWIGSPPGYGSFLETALVSLNFFDRPLIRLSYGLLNPSVPSYSSVMVTLFLHMYMIDVLAGFLGLATVLILCRRPSGAARAKN